MKRNTKQKSTAASPLFSIGQKPCEAWALKYATAISPEEKNAAMGVMRPNATRRPPTNSMIPADRIRPEEVMASEPKRPKSFWAP